MDLNSVPPLWFAKPSANSKREALDLNANYRTSLVILIFINSILLITKYFFEFLLSALYFHNRKLFAVIRLLVNSFPKIFTMIKI